MRLLIVTREHEAHRRYGMGKSIQPIQTELQRMGHEVRYLCVADRSAASGKRVDRIRRLLALFTGGRPGLAQLLNSALDAISMGWMASRIAVHDGYTHVHCHDVLIALGLIARLPGTRRSYRWGITQHAFGATVNAIDKWVCPLPSRLQRWLRPIEARLLRAANWVVVPTQAGLKRLTADLAIEATPSTWCVIPHPVPALERCTREDARSRLGWDPQRVYVVGIGWFAELKRFSLLIAACARLKHDVQLVLLGEGQADFLTAAAAELGLRRPPLISATDNIGLYLSAADVYVSASATESFGLANLEALAAGIPAVCTAVDAVPEVVGDAAVLVEGDAAALACAIERVIEQPDYAAELRARGLARARAWPDAIGTAKVYERLYAAS
jgi:glycosyltransferase involved in cell wall biosynthesis